MFIGQRHLKDRRDSVLVSLTLSKLGPRKDGPGSAKNFSLHLSLSTLYSKIHGKNIFGDLTLKSEFLKEQAASL